MKTKTISLAKFSNVQRLMSSLANYCGAYQVTRLVRIAGRWEVTYQHD